jgi:hypothetical protein
VWFFPQGVGIILEHCKTNSLGRYYIAGDSLAEWQFVDFILFFFFIRENQ